MLDSFPFALLVGTVLGVLSGLGIGGGSLLILWVTMALNMDPSTARVLNLLFFLPAALITALFRWRQNALPLSKILPGLIAGPVSSLLVSKLSGSLDTQLLRKGFGILLLLTGLRELFYHPKKKPGA